MNLSKIKDLIMGSADYDDEDDDLEEMVEEHQQVQKPMRPPVVPTRPPASNVLSLNQANTGKMEILNFVMSSYEMTGEIRSYIKSRKPIIVNMQKLDKTEVQRAIDYLTGACYALNGSVERVAEDIFIFAPEHINITPDQIKSKNIWPKV